MDIGAGRLLDNRYRLGPMIGSGGMAAVYSATDVRLCRAVAIKLFHPAADAITMARLEAEARTLAGLSHPGLVKIFDASTAGGRPYLVMQLVSGCTLRTMINRGPMDPAVVARLGTRLTETLRHVHSRHIMHRDIKPSNVLVDGSGACYLADFGIAKAIGAARLTASGHCVGTAAYLAPEQVAGQGAGPAADIYSLGLVLLECLTGRPEYTGTEAEAAIARLTRPPRIPSDLPPPLRRALTAMTARDPQDRADAATCVDLLGACLSRPIEPRTLPAVVAVREPTRQMPIPGSSLPPRRRLLNAAAAVAIGAGIVTGTAMSGGGGSPVVSEERPPAAPARPVQAPAVSVAPQTAAANVVVDEPPPAQPAPAAERPGRSDSGKGKDNGGGGNSGKGGGDDDGEDEDD
jgi:serine/threonine protein kinase